MESQVGRPGRVGDEAAARWSAASKALDAFRVRLTNMRATDPALVKLKARVLLAMYQGRLGNLDFAIEAALDKASREDNVCDEAMALSIARDVLAA